MKKFNSKSGALKKYILFKKKAKNERHKDHWYVENIFLKKKQYKLTKLK